MIILGRLEAGEDLVQGIEALAKAHNLTRAVIRGGPGSLMQGCLESGGPPIEVSGPGTEILTLIGEVAPNGASLHAVLGDPEGRIYAGRLIPGRNPVCITVEVALESIE